MKNALLILYCLFAFQVSSGEENNDIWSCQTLNIVQSKSTTLNSLPYTTEIKSINVFIHIIRNTDGTGGLNNEDTNSTLEKLKQDYEKANIIIHEIGRESINNSSYKYCNYTLTHFNDLFSINSHTNAIDIYFLPESNPVFMSDAIPGSAFAFGGTRKNTSVISHEMGHCLGLYHTHSGNGCDDYNNCQEDIDGSNSSTCGDQVSDTPADPCLFNNVDEDCNYTGGGDYNPDTENIMSYSTCTCINHFTLGQIDRMHNFLTNSEILQAPQTKINGLNRLSLNGNNSYSISDLPTRNTISWESNNLLTRISPQGANPCVFIASKSLSSQDSTSINATITTNNSSYTVSKTVYLGKQAPELSIYNIKDPNKIEMNGLTNYNYVCTALGEDYINNEQVYVWTLTSPSGKQINSVNSTNFNFTPSEVGEYSISINYGDDSRDKIETKKFYVSYSPSFNIHPNPASTNIRLEFENYVTEDGAFHSFNYEIVDQTTKTKLIGRVYDKKTLINVSDLKKGLYFVVIKTENNNYVEKLIIE